MGDIYFMSREKKKRKFNSSSWKVRERERNEPLNIQALLIYKEPQIPSWDTFEQKHFTSPLIYSLPLAMSLSQSLTHTQKKDEEREKAEEIGRRRSSNLLLCASLEECETIEEMVSSMDKAKQEGADLVELCMESVSFSHFSQLRQLFKQRSLPSIVSFRLISPPPSHCYKFLGQLLNYWPNISFERIIVLKLQNSHIPIIWLVESCLGFLLVLRFLVIQLFLMVLESIDDFSYFWFIFWEIVVYNWNWSNSMS